MNPRHFSTMTKDEIRELIYEIDKTVINVTDRMGISGLSEIGSHNLYEAIREMIKVQVSRAIIARLASGPAHSMGPQA